MASALNELSESDREVLTLSAWYGLTSAEAAQALGCTAGTYDVRLHRARRRLAHQMRPTTNPHSGPAPLLPHQETNHVH